MRHFSSNWPKDVKTWIICKKTHFSDLIAVFLPLEAYEAV